MGFTSCKAEHQITSRDENIDCSCICTPNLVLHYFEVLSDNIPVKVEPLYDYFEDNYLTSSKIWTQGCVPNFAIEMWSMYQQPEFGLPCTNNVVEDWHRPFQHKYLFKQF